MEYKEEFKNRNKKVILFIVVLIFLILSLTFVTYAFFTYYRTGGVNNQLRTGKIKLLFEEGENNISMTNQFPTPDVEAVALESSDTQSVIANFTVSGYASLIDLYYNIYAFAGDVEANGERISDEHIKLYLTVTTNDEGYSVIANGYGTADDVNGIYGALASSGRGSTDTSLGGEIFLAQGQVGTLNTIHNYTLRMWISDTVKISDTDTTAQYCASETECVDDRTIFSDSYYSLKLRVQNLDMDE